MNFSSLAGSSDLSGISLITFGEIEAYSKKESGFENTSKAYKFFAEPCYLHEVLMTAQCFHGRYSRSHLSYFC